MRPFSVANTAPTELYLANFTQEAMKQQKKILSKYRRPTTFSAMPRCAKSTTGTGTMV